MVRDSIVSCRYRCRKSSVLFTFN